MKKIFFYITILIFNYFILVISDYFLSKFFPIDFERNLNNKIDKFQESLSMQEFYFKNSKKFDDLKFPLYPFSFFLEDLYKKEAIEANIVPLGLLPFQNYIKCLDEGYGYQISSTDRLGFFNNDLVWDEEKIDILIIGDSFGSSYCVKQQNTLDFNLENSGLKVINLSHGGNSPIIYASLFLNFSKLKKFSNIIIIFYANDNIYEKNSNYYLKYFLNNNINNEGYFKTKKNGEKEIEGVWGGASELTLHQDVYNFIQRLEHSYNDSFLKKTDSRRVFNNFFLENYWLRSIKYLKLEKLRYYALFLYDLTFEDVPFSSKLIIDMVEEYCKVNQCHANYIYIPYNNFKSKIYFNEIYVEKLSRYIEKKEKKLINLKYYFNEDMISSYYSVKGHHLSPYGYKILSDIIKEKLKK